MNQHQGNTKEEVQKGNRIIIIGLEDTRRQFQQDVVHVQINQ